MKKLAAAFLILVNPYLMAATPSTLRVGELELEYCHISGFSQEVLCGDYAVYEDRSTQGKQIDIQFDIRGQAGAGGVLFAEFFSEILPEGVSKAEILSGGPLFPNPGSFCHRCQ